MSEVVSLVYKIGKVFGSGSSTDICEPALGRANLYCHAASDSCVTWPQRIVAHFAISFKPIEIVSRVAGLLLIFIAVSCKLYCLLAYWVILPIFEQLCPG